MIYKEKITKAILLVRHGEAEHHLNGLTGGWTDSNLTSLGIQQAHRNAIFLSELLKKEKAKIYSSDLKRAVQTANVIHKYVKCDVEILPDLRELNNGIAANMNETEAQKIALPKNCSYLNWRHYPNAENCREFYNRISVVMENIVSEQNDFSVIVTHNGSIRNALYWWLEIGLSELYEKISFASFPASITAIGINKWHEKTIFFQNLCIDNFLTKSIDML